MPMRRSGESGYALLLVFLMAAILAITLYSEIPRAAFQAQRRKEQLLYARGQEYIRGIYMFRQAFPGQPLQRMEDLETFQSRHFVRHKYIDPMTGKAEWRIIHMQNGVLIDSKVSKAQDQSQQTSQNYFITPGTGVGGTDFSGGGQSTVRPQDRKRPSEGGSGGGSDSLPPIPGPVSDGAASNPVDGARPADGQNTTDPQTGRNTTTQPNVTPLGGSGPTPTQIPTGSSAGNLINQLLTQPRQQSATAVGAAGANGIAGIASKAEMEGIMLYKDRSAYDEWEFVFDATRTAVAGLGAGMGNGPMAGNPQQTGQAPMMQNRLGQPVTTDQSSGTQGLFGGGGSGGQGGSGQGRSGSGQGTQSGGAGTVIPPSFRPGRP
jgi:hypothetical protein